MPRLFSAPTLLLLVTAAASTATAGDQVLQDEVSRADLAIFAMTEFDGDRAFPLAFQFPAHVRDESLFGVDVSHHQGEVDWSKLPPAKVRFAYVKATQGERFYDDQFDRNWRALSEMSARGSVLRGAYHFFSATGNPDTQAANFSDAVGRLSEYDMPACLDMEWDFRRENGRVVTDAAGKPVDSWAALTPKEIVDRSLRWLQIVEQRTSRKPIIYTNAHWWSSRIGDEGRRLQGYKFWMADYSTASLNRESPKIPEGHTAVLWQLSDRGRVSGVRGGFDTNKILLTPDKFYAEIGVKPR